MADHRMWCTFVLGVCFVGFVWAENKVQVTVYYESLCPDSKSFFLNQLWPTYNAISNYMTVEVVPFGNAHYSYKHGTYEFTCQHGPKECYGNMVQSCFVTLVNDTAKQIEFINCAFKTVQEKSMEQCISDKDMRRQVKKCVTSPMGRELLHEMGKKTAELTPSHTFIPWITINGKGSEDLTYKVIDDMLSVVCNEIQGDKPGACSKSKFQGFKKFRYYYL